MKAPVVHLDADHPGFNDSEYRSRRNDIALLALSHVPGTPAPIVKYTDQERLTWKTIYASLVDLHPTHACEEYMVGFAALQYCSDEVPQLAAVSEVLQQRTGFRMEPVAGLVSPRDFLAALSNRVFCSTQYIRHHTRPHYTPEPDVVHELMGHAPMLAIHDFADLSQRLGEGARDASDDKVDQLATLYWYTIEYGLVRQQGRLRAFGAGLLSSYGELTHALSGKVEVLRFDPAVARKVPYPITSYQPLLWEVPSIHAAFAQIDAFLRS